MSIETKPCPHLKSAEMHHCPGSESACGGKDWNCIFHGKACDRCGHVSGSKPEQRQVLEFDEWNEVHECPKGDLYKGFLATSIGRGKTCHKCGHVAMPKPEKRPGQCRAPECDRSASGEGIHCADHRPVEFKDPFGIRSQPVLIAETISPCGNVVQVHSCPKGWTIRTPEKKPWKPYDEHIPEGVRAWALEDGQTCAHCGHTAKIEKKEDPVYDQVDPFEYVRRQRQQMGMRNTAMAGLGELATPGPVSAAEHALAYTRVQLAEMTRDRDTLQERIEAQRKLTTEARKDCNKNAEKCGTLQRQFDEAIAQRDGAYRERDAVIVKRDDMSGQVALAQKDRDTYKGQLEIAKQDRDGYRIEFERALKEKGEAQAELAKTRQERDALLHLAEPKDQDDYETLKFQLEAAVERKDELAGRLKQAIGTNAELLGRLNTCSTMIEQHLGIPGGLCVDAVNAMISRLDKAEKERDGWQREYAKNVGGEAIPGGGVIVHGVKYEKKKADLKIEKIQPQPKGGSPMFRRTRKVAKIAAIVTAIYSIGHFGPLKSAAFVASTVSSWAEGEEPGDFRKAVVCSECKEVAPAGEVREVCPKCGSASFREAVGRVVEKGVWPISDSERFEERGSAEVVKQ